MEISNRRFKAGVSPAYDSPTAGNEPDGYYDDDFEVASDSPLHEEIVHQKQYLNEHIKGSTNTVSQS